LARSFFDATAGAPSSEALQSALNVIEAKAHFDSPEQVVYIRVGGLSERLYLDLANESWQAIEIDATGWRVVDKPPVRFRRAAGMQPLPRPGRAVLLRRCAPSSMSKQKPTSCWPSLGCWRRFATAGLIQSWSCQASRDRRSPPFRSF
jgi:hypothetical protein